MSLKQGEPGVRIQAFCWIPILVMAEFPVTLLVGPRLEKRFKEAYSVMLSIVLEIFSRMAASVKTLGSMMEAVGLK